MIQRYLKLKPACDMLQDSNQWGSDTLSLNHSDKHLLERIEFYLTPITKQILSVEGKHCQQQCPQCKVVALCLHLQMQCV